MGYVAEFFTSPLWRPTSDHNPTYGTLALFTGTASVTGLAMLVSVPFSLGAAIFIGEFATGRTRETLKILVELLAAIPSVVWGFIGLSIMNPLIIDVFDVPVGLSVLNSGIIVDDQRGNDSVGLLQGLPFSSSCSHRGREFAQTFRVSDGEQA